MKLPTWLIEQAVLVACLALGLSGQLAAHPDARAIAIGALSALAALAGQKVRSGADRQREQDELSGYEPAHLHCAARIAVWSLVAQALSLFVGIVAAPSWRSMPAVLFVAFYGLWRRWYRSWRPPQLEV
jgi:hypothetical protein